MEVINKNIIEILRNKEFKYFNDCIEYCLDAGFNLKDSCKIAHKFNLKLNNGVYMSESYIMQFIKTWEDIINILRIRKIPSFRGIPIEYKERFIAEYKLLLIIKVLNNNWIKDWNDSNEYYYVPYFDMRNGSFSYYYYNGWNGYSDGAVGLGFKNKELLLHAVKYFLKEYEIYFKSNQKAIIENNKLILEKTK